MGSAASALAISLPLEEQSMIAPIMICGFKRPDCLRQVVDAVRRIQAPKLYLVLDAPRDGHPDDQVGYEACKLIFDGIDWPCEVHRNYAQRNMGCGVRMTTGINWVFEHEDRAIILEDDCVPHQSFFRFCDELLEKYALDDRVGMISGTCEHYHKAKLYGEGQSYYFDRMCLVWGWATWRRAWRNHDPDLCDFPQLRESRMMINVLKKSRYLRQWERNVQRIYDKKQNTWAGAWAYTLYREGQLVAHSVSNPIRNVGAGMSSRGAKYRSEFPLPGHMSCRNEEIAFPLKHPVSFIPDETSERYCFAETLYVSKLRKAVLHPLIALQRLVSFLGKT